MDQRQTDLTHWVTRQLRELSYRVNENPDLLTPVSGDASFRRYFRAVVDGESFIAMDAPPEKEDSSPFVAIARSWIDCGVPVPQIHVEDLSQGFMLLSDMGDTLYLERLNDESADALYQQALRTLINIQHCHGIEGYSLPPYDKQRLSVEMKLCPEWFFTRLLGLDLNEAELQLFSAVSDQLVKSALEQPQVCVHRDYHSRNLMLLPDDSIGVLDFQDAVIGPITYDLVSLLRDCYINWPAEREQKWIGDFVQLAQQAELIGDIDDGQFKQWFDWMGLQRHIKCVGIFSRLFLRDGKAGYLNDIPRTFNYLKQVCAAYDEFTEFDQWLDSKVIPAMLDSHHLSLDATA